MKSINQYITEKLIIKKRKYNYFPETREDLIKCITEHFNNKNTDLSDIDVSNVTSFESVFRKISLLKYRDFEEIDVTGWNTSNVTDMKRMFFNCFKLKKIKGIEDWDVSNVTDMHGMFYGCPKLNIDLSDWKLNPECDIEKIVYNSEFVILPKLY